MAIAQPNGCNSSLSHLLVTVCFLFFYFVIYRIGKSGNKTHELKTELAIDTNGSDLNLDEFLLFATTLLKVLLFVRNIEASVGSIHYFTRIMLKYCNDLNFRVKRM